MRPPPPRKKTQTSQGVNGTIADLSRKECYFFYPKFMHKFREDRLITIFFPGYTDFRGVVVVVIAVVSFSQRRDCFHRCWGLVQSEAWLLSSSLLWSRSVSGVVVVVIAAGVSFSQRRGCCCHR